MLVKISFFIIGLSVGWFLHHYGIELYLKKFPLGLCDYCQYYNKKKNRQE